MTPLEAIVGQLDAFRIAHHREVDAWAERRHAEIHAMSVARTRGMGQLFRHATAHVNRIFPTQLHLKEIR